MSRRIILSLRLEIQNRTLLCSPSIRRQKQVDVQEMAQSVHVGVLISMIYPIIHGSVMDLGLENHQMRNAPCTMRHEIDDVQTTNNHHTSVS